MKPKMIPQAIPETEAEKKLFDEAAVRREFRLVVSGKMKPSDAKFSQDFLSK